MPRYSFTSHSLYAWAKVHAADCQKAIAPSEDVSTWKTVEAPDWKAAREMLRVITHEQEQRPDVEVLVCPCAKKPRQ